MKAYENVEHVSDLGVTIDNKVKFSAHVPNVCCKAHNRVNLILRSFIPRDISLLIAVFKVYVRPILEYCSVVWNPYLIKDIRLSNRFKNDLLKEFLA